MVVMAHREVTNYGVIQAAGSYMHEPLKKVAAYKHLERFAACKQQRNDGFACGVET